MGKDSNVFFDFLGAIGEAATMREQVEQRRREEVRALKARLAYLEGGGDCSGTPEPRATPAPQGVGQLLKALRAESFDDSKLTLIYGLSRPITCGEAALLLEIFRFDEGRLSAAKYLHTLVVDKENWASVGSTFRFSYSRAEALKGRV